MYSSFYQYLDFHLLAIKLNRNCLFCLSDSQLIKSAFKLVAFLIAGKVSTGRPYLCIQFEGTIHHGERP